MGNRWYTASVKGLSSEGQVEVFCKNDTDHRFINFNQLRLSPTTPTYFGEEKVICSFVERDGSGNDVTKDWYRGTLREFGEEAIVDREPRENNIRTATF
eukprot:TRINITY_DN2351_c0_g1_i1.p1 TRINITY_DN2351_c0_g1~~TRINITY_DN2351_c0_g1_i1.p1  ORF type:complete len:99 (+),score=7.49 TRINITY_DN2351_c0_g1_i1:43-339(+)